MSWSLLSGAGWAVGFLAAATTVKHLFFLLRHRISERSETDRFTKALEGSTPHERPAIIRAYSRLAKIDIVDDSPAEGK